MASTAHDSQPMSVPARLRPRSRARCRRDARGVSDQGGFGTNPVGSRRSRVGSRRQSCCTVSAVNLALESGRSYRPFPMQPAVIRLPDRSRSATWSAGLAAVLCSALLTACGQGASPPLVGPHGQEMGKTVTSSAPTAVTRSPFPPQVVSQVISGWLAAESAFADAARTSDPDAPELAATTIDPQLTWSRSLLGRMEASGQIAEGPVHYGTPRVIAFHGDQATVRTCARDAEIVVFAASGRAAPGILGQVDYELFTSTMRQTEGGWKLLTQVVGVGECDRL